MGIRVRLYGTERMRRERMIGEAVVGFASVNQDTETTHWLTLEPRSNLSVCKTNTHTRTPTPNCDTFYGMGTAILGLVTRVVFLCFWMSF